MLFYSVLFGYSSSYEAKQIKTLISEMDAPASVNKAFLCLDQTRLASILGLARRPSYFCILS